MDLMVSLRTIRGERVGLPKLTIEARVKSNSEGIQRILYVGAEVRASNSLQVYDPMKSTHFLGYAQLESESTGQFTTGSEDTWTFGLALVPYQLQTIEEARKGGDLFLVMRFYGMVAELENPSAPQCSSAGCITTPQPADENQHGYQRR